MKLQNMLGEDAVLQHDSLFDGVRCWLVTATETQIQEIKNLDAVRTPDLFLTMQFKIDSFQVANVDVNEVVRKISYCILT